MPTIIATLSSEGQLALPQSVRDALQLRAGSKLGVRIEGACIILEPQRPAWEPQNPLARSLSVEALCAPVDCAKES